MNIELIEPLEQLLSALDGGIDLSDIPQMRVRLDALFDSTSFIASATPRPQIQRHRLQHGSLFEYTPTNSREYVSPQPALLWCHGGGYIMGRAEHDHPLCQRISDSTGCRVFSLSYPLAPEQPYPHALLCAAQAWQYLQTQGSAMGLNTAKIAVGGASAGAGLAASLCLYLRDHAQTHGHQPLLQWLMYPMLDVRTSMQGESPKKTTAKLWTRDCNLIAWQALLGKTWPANPALPEPYFSPSLVAHLNQLPAVFMAVGDLDLFHDEVLLYAQRLRQAGIHLELHVFPGAPHAFDTFAPQSRLTQQFEQLRMAALQRSFDTLTHCSSP